jgi:RND family efflux transporter MFP subunit
MKKLLVSSCLAINIFLAACSSQKESKTNRDKYPVTSPIVADTVYVREYVADIHSVQNVEIRTRVKGYIEDILVDEGKPVKAGQIIFRISSQEYKEELVKAKANLNSAIASAKAAQLDLKNAKVLQERKIISETEVEMAEAKLDALNAKVEEARSEETSASLKLSFAEIRAPFNGVINRIPYKKGSLVDEGTLLTSLSDDHEIFTYFNVSEKEYLDFIAQKTSGDKNEVSLILANNMIHPYKGKVETIEGEFNKATGNIAFRARFANPNGILKHGSSGKVQLRTEIKGALIIPQKSTFEVQDKLYVYVIDSGNTVKLRSIVPKLRIPHLYIIEIGLSSSDKIIYEGIQNVKEGEIITPEMIPMRQIINQLAK